LLPSVSRRAVALPDTSAILRGDSCTDANVNAIADANINAIADINIEDRDTDARPELGRGWLQCIH